MIEKSFLFVILIPVKIPAKMTECINFFSKKDIRMIMVCEGRDTLPRFVCESCLPDTANNDMALWTWPSLAKRLHFKSEQIK